MGPQKFPLSGSILICLTLVFLPASFRLKGTYHTLRLVSYFDTPVTPMLRPAWLDDKKQVVDL